MAVEEQLVCSVIICVRNGEATIGAQLRALAAQVNAPPFELLVVDNGSTDGTVDTYRQWALEGTGAVTRSRVVDAGERAGLGFARNSGAWHASTDILAYCDADDVVAPGWVRALVEAIVSDGSRAVAGQILTLTLDGLPSSAVIMGHLDGIGPADGALHVYPFFWGCSFALTRESFVRAGGFDENLPPYGCDDIDIGIRLGKQLVPISFAPDMQVYYRPPKGVRLRLRRKFRAGVAQACLWARHPDTYVRASPMRSAFSVPRELVATLQEDHSVATKVRCGLELMAKRSGEMWGALAWVRMGRLGPARYFVDRPVA